MEDLDADSERDFRETISNMGEHDDQPGPKPLDDYPHLRAVAAASSDIFEVTNRQLTKRFHFVEEIGKGNWGVVWKAIPRHVDAAKADMREVRKLGRASAVSGGSSAGGVVAIKMVHLERDKDNVSTVPATSPYHPMVRNRCCETLS